MKTITKLALAVIIFMTTIVSNRVAAQGQTKEELMESINKLSGVYHGFTSDYFLEINDTKGNSRYSYYTDNPKDDYELLFNLKNDINIDNSSVEEYEDGYYIKLIPKNKIKQIKNNVTTYSTNPIKILTKTSLQRATFLLSKLSDLAGLIEGEKPSQSANNESQNKKVNLTKEETVRYLDKKIKEIHQNYRTVQYTDNEGKLQKMKFYYIDEPSIILDGDKVKITVYRANNYKKLYPAQEKLYTGDFSHQYVYKETISCDYGEQEMTDEFNPAHIISIDKGTDYVNGEPVGSIVIKLKSKTGIKDWISYGSRQYVTSMYGKHCIDFGKLEGNNREVADTVYINYLQSDDTNFDKIRKALEHLKSLLDAEDDPFG